MAQTRSDEVQLYQERLEKMARATLVKAARKDYPAQGIKKGESYYWWKFRFGGKHFSKTPPKQSQLTGSEFLSSVYAALESLEDLGKDREAAALAIRQASEDIQEAVDQVEDNLGNMPDGLQEGDTGQMMQSRIDDGGQLASNLEQIADDLDGLPDEEAEEGESPEDLAERLAEILEEKIQEAQALSYEGE